MPSTEFVAAGTDRAKEAEATGKLRSESNIERVFRMSEDSFVVVVKDADSYPLSNDQIYGAPPVKRYSAARRINRTPVVATAAAATTIAAYEVLRWLL